MRLLFIFFPFFFLSITRDNAKILPILYLRVIRISVSSVFLSLTKSLLYRAYCATSIKKYHLSTIELSFQVYFLNIIR